MTEAQQNLLNLKYVCARVHLCEAYQRAFHDAFEVNEVQVIGCGGAGRAVAHCVQHLGHCDTHTHTVKGRTTLSKGNMVNETVTNDTELVSIVVTLL